MSTEQAGPLEVRSNVGLEGDAPMRTLAEKRAYSRGYMAGLKRSKADPANTTPTAELSALVDITRTRNAHLEIELAQARASRDLLKEKYTKVSDWMRAHVRIAADGTVMLVRPEPSNV